MRNLGTKTALVLVVMMFAAWSIFPPDEKLRRGKDLAGGVSLVYAVDVGQNESPRETLNQVIDVLRKRLDPTGQLQISLVAQGNDRIEVTMPLPTEAVKALRADYQRALERLDEGSMSVAELERMLRLDEGERAARIAEVSAGRSGASDLLNAAAARFDAFTETRAAFEAGQAQLDFMEVQFNSVLTGGQPEVTIPLEEIADIVQTLQLELVNAANRAATAQREYESARDAALSLAVPAERLREALRLSNEPRVLIADRAEEAVEIPSPRSRALERLRTDFPGSVQEIEEVIALYDIYESKRTTLDDPADLKRLIQASGVLNFRINVGLGEYAEEARLRAQLQEVGPRQVRDPQASWYKVNNIDNWVDEVDQMELLLNDPAAFFGSLRGLVGEEYNGEYWVLCWDTPGSRLTETDGTWSLTRSYQGMDDLGRPSIAFVMDPNGAQLLARLTRPNQGNPMAILLDDEVYTVATLQSEISSNGQITGDFSQAELQYIIRVLNAGSLQARLSPDPISESTLAPTLGQDNLDAGLLAGYIALAGVSVFMIFYYFAYGLVAVISLFVNAMLILAAMSLNRAAFTLPGIAGVVLTFGIAVDANVLIYERIREELIAGSDLRTAIRLGFQRALSSIVDGNVTNLIVCVVLGTFGTPEIKGFAITLGIGVVSTMFTALVVTRMMFAYIVDVGRIRKMGMLATAVPAIHRALEPRIDWMAGRWVFRFISIVAVVSCIAVIASRGSDMLDNEFRGGTAVTIQLRNLTPAELAEAPDGVTTKKLTRGDVADALQEIADEVDPDSPLQTLRTADVLAVNADADNVTSDQFTIKTLVDQVELLQSAITTKFADVLDTKAPIAFDGQAADPDAAPAYSVLGPDLGSWIERPDVLTRVDGFIGGVAIVLDNMSPPQSVDDIRDRIDQVRSQPEFNATVGRSTEIIVLDGTDDQATSVAVVVADENLNFFVDEARWMSRLRNQEWTIVQTAMTQTTTLAQIESFSPSVAESFRATAMVSIFLAAMLIAGYVWVRFGSLRYSLAALLTTLHDVIIVVGLIAFAEIFLGLSPTLAGNLGILPFKIDLNLVAAVLTILGYSLNDTIIVMDRIRENRGKLPSASRAVVNLSINQTISRTLITSGTTVVSVGILYMFGGEGVRELAYALLVGVLVGTYSSIAVASPFVWSGKGSATDPVD